MIYKPEHCRPCCYYLPDGCDLDSRYTATRWPTAGPACRHFEREPGADDEDVTRGWDVAAEDDNGPVWFWWWQGAGA